MLHTKQFLVFLMGLIVSFKKSFEDGQFKLGQDLQHFIDDFLAAPDAFNGIDQIDNENAAASLEDREDLRTDVFNALSGINEDDQYDISHGVTGILSFLRMLWRRALEKGKEQGRKDLLAELQSHKEKGGTIESFIDVAA